MWKVKLGHCVFYVNKGALCARGRPLRVHAQTHTRTNCPSKQAGSASLSAGFIHKISWKNSADTTHTHTHTQLTEDFRSECETMKAEPTHTRGTPLLFLFIEIIIN